MSCKIIFIFVGACLLLNYSSAQNKAGDCPPLLQYNICTNSCYSDTECKGIFKCCPTTCGGAVCIRPVVMKTPQIAKGIIVI